MKKLTIDIIILRMCTKNHNHMMNGSWDTEWDRQNFGSENQNFEKKLRKYLEILPLSFHTYMCTINENHMIHGSWNIRCDRQKFSSFWVIFFPFSLLTTWKIKILTLKFYQNIVRFDLVMNDFVFCDILLLKQAAKTEIAKCRTLLSI